MDILVIDVVAFMAFTKQEFSCDTRSINTEKCDHRNRYFSATIFCVM